MQSSPNFFPPQPKLVKLETAPTTLLMEFNLSKLPPEYKQDLLDFFQKCADISGESHPKSTSPDGSGKFRVLKSGKQIPEQQNTLQAAKFEELFSFFSDLPLFDFIYNKYFALPDSNLSKDDLRRIFLGSLTGTLGTAKLILEQAGLTPDQFINSLKQMQNDIGTEMSGTFTGLSGADGITSSDIISNMLFTKTSMLTFDE